MKRLPPALIALGIASLLTDMSSEMIYPLLPIFLTHSLGATPVVLGLIEGAAEAVASLLKVVSGVWTDKLASRKPFILVGYSLAGAMRPLIGLATAWPQVFALRFLDRVGKGIRTSPRDALIADIIEPQHRGHAYGFHRMMDHAGAVLGPLVAAALMSLLGFSMQAVFIAAAVPAAIVVAVIVFGVSDPKIKSLEKPEAGVPRARLRELGPEYRRFLLALVIYTLGNSTDAFFLLRMNDAGLAAGWVAVVWSLHHVVKMVSSYIGGRVSDLIGPRRVIIAGWILYAAIYLAFAFLSETVTLVAVFLLYGVTFGMTEPTERAWVAHLAPKRLRGTAMGYYHGAIGFASLPASLFFGLLWQYFGVAAAFSAGAALAGVGALLLLRVADPAHRPGH